MLKLPFQSLLPAVFRTRFIQLGLAALIGFSIVIIFAFRPIRARFYELFFYAHFSLIL